MTALSPIIGYDKASKIARHVMDNDLMFKEAALRLGFVAEVEAGRAPRKMYVGASAAAPRAAHL